MATTTQGTVIRTYKDYCATPDDERYELLNGNLMMVPAPNRKHQEVLARTIRGDRDSAPGGGAGTGLGHGQRGMTSGRPLEGSQPRVAGG